MGLRLRTEITSSLSVDYRFDFYDSSYGGSTVEFVANDFEINWTPINDELLCPIITSELTIRLLDDGTSGVDTAITSIETSDEESIQVAVYRDLGSGYELYWVGVVLKESFERMNEPEPTEVIIRAVDGLSRLADIRYPGIAGGTHTGSSPMAQFIVECLSENGLSGFWGTSDPYLRESIEWVSNEVTSPGATDSPLLYTRCHVLHFRDKPNEPETTNKTCQETIEGIMKLYGAQIFHANGSYYIRQPRNYDGSYTERKITKLLAVTQASVTNQVEVLNDSTRSTAVPTTGYVRVHAGGAFRNSPPLDKVRATMQPTLILNYEREASTPLDNTTKSKTYSYTLGTVKGGTGYFLAFNFEYDVYEPDYELKITITVTLPGGTTYYLDYDQASAKFSWSTSSATAILYGSVGDWRDFQWGIRTATLPTGTFTGATASVKYEYWDRKTNSQPATVTGYVIVHQPSIKVVTTNETLEDVEVEIDNPSTTGNSVVLDLGDSWFTDESIISTRNTFEINSTGSTWVEAVDWACGFDADYSLAYSMLLERMSYQRTPVRMYRGKFDGFYEPQFSINYNGEIYVMKSLRWSGKMDEFDGDWWKLNRATGSIEVGDQRPTGGELFRDPIQKKDNGDWRQNQFFVYTRIGEVGADIASGASVTTIELINQIGHDNVLQGDLISIVHPLTGQEVQDFEVSATAGTSDTSITVTSENADLDILYGWMVMHKKWALTSSDVVRGEQINFRSQINEGDAVDNSAFHDSTDQIYFKQDGVSTPLGDTITVTTLSQAQIQALNSAPVTIVASPGAGKYIEVLRCTLFYDHNGTEFSGSSGQLTIEYATSGVDIGVNNDNPFLETGDKYVQFQLNAGHSGMTDLDDLINNAVQITNSVSYTGAAGTATVKCYYKVITV